MPKYPNVRQRGTKRGKERWQGYFKYKGVPYVKSGFNKPSEAYKWVYETRTALDNGSYIDESDITLQQFIDDIYFPTYCHWRDTTKKIAIYNFTKYIIPYLGDYKVQEIKPYHIQKIVNSIEKKVSSKKARAVLEALRTVLNVAVDKEEILVRNPAKKIDLPKVTAPRRTVISKEDMQKLIDSAYPRDSVIIAIAVYTGMRRGEIFALRWKDIDFKTGTIAVSKSLAEGVEVPTKTGETRTIPIHYDLRAILSGWISISEKYLFLNQYGEQLQAEKWSKDTFKKLLQKNGLSTGIRFHDIRHSFITHALHDGMPLHEVQTLVGHKPQTITEGLYGQPTIEQLKASINKLSFGKMSKRMSKTDSA